MTPGSSRLPAPGDPPPGGASHAGPPARTWVIDAANVVGARPDGWWRDRAGAAARLHARVQELLAAGEWPGCPDGADRPAAVVLVLEGAARAGVAAGTSWEAAGQPVSPPGARRGALTVVHAAGAGDDAIVMAVLAAEPPVLAWTSYRALRARLGAVGAQVRGAGGLWALLDGSQPQGSIKRLF